MFAVNPFKTYKINLNPQSNATAYVKYKIILVIISSRNSNVFLRAKPFGSDGRFIS
jgi:hypothetical protein